MGPGESGPDPHFHRTITESFYVLEGSVAIFNGERWIDTQPGDWVHVPEGGIHGFKNRSGGPAAMLLSDFPADGRAASLPAQVPERGKDRGRCASAIPRSFRVGAMPTGDLWLNALAITGQPGIQVSRGTSIPRYR